jgi:hypothetical protein
VVVINTPTINIRINKNLFFILRNCLNFIF